MAHLHFRRDVYKSGGRQAAERIAYITRQPIRGHAEQQVRYISEGREDCLFTTSKNLPAWAQGNPYHYFAAAERAEGVGWVAFEELKISLPVELSHGQNMALTRNLVHSIAGDTLPITYAFHAPQTLDAQHEQPHLHLLLSRRQTDAHDRGPVQHFRKYNAAHPERGGARKDPAFAERLAQRQLRVLVSDVINLHLERAGCEGRVHPGTLKSRGIAREPEPKLVPSESRAYREDGTVSPRMQQVLDVRAVRQQTRAEEQANAHTYWEERKVTLGITADMDVPAQLAAICEARAHVRDQTSTRQVLLSAVGMEQDDRTLGDLAGEAYAQASQEAQGLWMDVQEEQRLRDLWGKAAAQATQEARDVWEEAQAEQAMLDDGWAAVRTARDDGHAALAAALRDQQAQEQTRAWRSLEQDLQALAAQLDRLGEESAGRGTVRIRLWERDQGRGF